MSKTSKDGQAVDAVLKYLNSQNRPYSANDIFNNLHKEYGKTAVERALDALADDRKIHRKLNGKQKAYVADQSQFAAVNESELKEMELRIQTLTEEVKTSQAANDRLAAELRSLTSALTTDEARQKLADLNQKIARASEKLNELKSMGKGVSPEERQKVVKSREVMVKEWRKRKRLATDILDAILEGYPKKKKDLYEEVGVETDEEYNQTIPAL